MGGDTLFGSPHGKGEVGSLHDGASYTLRFCGCSVVVVVVLLLLMVVVVVVVLVVWVVAVVGGGDSGDDDGDMGGGVGVDGGGGGVEGVGVGGEFWGGRDICCCRSLVHSFVRSVNSSVP